MRRSLNSANSNPPPRHQPWIAAIKGAKDKTALAVEMAKLQRLGVGGLFGVGVSVDAKTPTSYIVSTGQSGLGLPDRDYYLKADPKLVETKAAYQAYLAKMLGLIGAPRYKAAERIGTARASV